LYTKIVPPDDNKSIVNDTSKTHPQDVTDFNKPPSQYTQPQNQILEKQDLNIDTNLKKGKLLPRDNICDLHNSLISYFCESCEEPICNDCINNGPHNNELHRLTNIEQSYSKRFNGIAFGSYGALMQKRDKLSNQIRSIDFRIEEIKSTSLSIEREIKTEYSGIIDRLKSVGGTKQAVLQHEMSTIQADIEKIDSIVKVLDDFIKGDLKNDMTSFLKLYKNLNEHIEFSITKPYKSTIDVLSNDLPRELIEQRNLAHKVVSQEALLKAKDDIIFNLVQENKKVLNNVQNDLDQAAQREIEEWAKLTDKYAQELQKYQLVCAFCGIGLDDISVNSICEKNLQNTDRNSEQKDQKYSIENPPENSQNNGRHYFVKPISEIINKSTNKIIFDSLTNPIDALRELALKMHVNLEEELKKLDISNNKQVAWEDFERMLTNVFNLDKDQIGKIIQALGLSYDTIKISKIFPETNLSNRPNYSFRNSSKKKARSDLDKSRDEELSKKQHHCNIN